MSVGWVSRTTNGVAHYLAKFTRGIVHEIPWMEESAPLALEALYLDLSKF